MTVIQAYAPTTNAEEVKIEQFYDDLLELIPKKDFHDILSAKLQPVSMEL